MNKNTVYIRGMLVLIAPGLIKIQFNTGVCLFVIAPGLRKTTVYKGVCFLIAPGLIKNTVNKGVCCFDSPWFNKKIQFIRGMLF